MGLESGRLQVLLEWVGSRGSKAVLGSGEEETLFLTSLFRFILSKPLFALVLSSTRFD